MTIARMWLPTLSPNPPPSAADSCTISISNVAQEVGGAECLIASFKKSGTYALVGSAGVFSSGVSSVTPAWGSGESRTANNLLICWSLSTSGTRSGTPSGWSLAVFQNNLSTASAIFYKIAAGGDAAPTLTSASTAYAALAEFSGNATSSPLDQSFDHENSLATLTVTNPAPDAGHGELVIYLGNTQYKPGQTGTVSGATLNNGATATDTNTGDGTTVFQFEMGYGITT